MTRDEARANVEREVVYTPPESNDIIRRPKRGRIARVTDSYVFVQYGEYVDGGWTWDEHSKATAAAFLELAGELA